jgi:hypothetical protein
MPFKVKMQNSVFFKQNNFVNRTFGIEISLGQSLFALLIDINICISAVIYIYSPIHESALLIETNWFHAFIEKFFHI